MALLGKEFLARVASVGRQGGNAMRTAVNALKDPLAASFSQESGPLTPAVMVGSSVAVFPQQHKQPQEPQQQVMPANTPTNRMRFGTLPRSYKFSPHKSMTDVTPADVQARRFHTEIKKMSEQPNAFRPPVPPVITFDKSILEESTTDSQSAPVKRTTTDKRSLHTSATASASPGGLKPKKEKKEAGPTKPFEPKKILVLGAEGNIGGNMVRHAQKLGHSVKMPDHHLALGCTKEEKAAFPLLDQQTKIKEEKNKKFLEVIGKLKKVIEAKKESPKSHKEFLEEVMADLGTDAVTPQGIYIRDFLNDLFDREELVVAVKPFVYRDTYAPLLELYLLTDTKLEAKYDPKVFVSPMAGVTRGEIQKVMPDKDEVLTSMPVNAPDGLKTTVVLLSTARRNYALEIFSSYLDVDLVRVVENPDSVKHALILASGPGYVRQGLFHLLRNIPADKQLEVLENTLQRTIEILKGHSAENTPLMVSKETDPYVAFMLGIAEGMKSELCENPEFKPGETYTDIALMLGVIMHDLQGVNGKSVKTVLEEGIAKITSAKGTTIAAIMFGMGYSNPLRTMDTLGLEPGKVKVIQAKVDHVDILRKYQYDEAQKKGSFAFYELGKKLGAVSGRAAVDVGKGKTHFDLASEA